MDKAHSELVNHPTSIDHTSELKFAYMLQGRPIVCYILVATNVVLFIAAFLWGLSDRFAPLKQELEPVMVVFLSGLKVNELIHRGEHWRVVSAMWVHLDFLHIIFNMYGLLALGPLLEKFYGSRRLFIIYMVSGIVGGIASYAFVLSPSGGASGAIYGLAGGLIAVGFKYRHDLPDRVTRALTRGMIPYIIFGIGIGFFSFIPMDNAAHIGGLLGGAVVTFFMRTRLEQDMNPSPVRNAIVNILTILFIGVVAYSAFKWQGEARRCVVDTTTFLKCYGNP